MQILAPEERPALVMSGGGVRGAYGVGVLQGMVEVLGLRRHDPPPFGMFSGSSVGAINAAFMAAHTHRGDLALEHLARLWLDLRLERHLRVDPLGLFALRKGPLWPPWRRSDGVVERRSLLDARALEKLISDGIPWQALRTNVAQGRTRALFVSALHIASGRTTVFAELSPQTQYTPTIDPRRQSAREPITAAHVLASCALPLIFPPRRIGARYYADGGLRYNTPLAPVLRAGARRIVIISLLAPARAMAEAEAVERYPSPIFLAGKLLNALLLDPIVHDLAVLKRFNRLIRTLDTILDPEERAQVDAVLRDARGLPYRHVEVLDFRPSADIGALAAEHIRHHLPHWQLDRPSNWLLRRIAREDAQWWEADLASYLLFDGNFAARLIELGRVDAHRRSDEIRAFYAAADGG